MPNRPAIPAEIVRIVLTESGHRCAVCGVPCPLERAHIIPWHRSRKHRAEDLICLCANCHQRADHEKWGEKSLREYKRSPWIARGNHRNIEDGSITRVRFLLEVDFEHFDDHQENMVRHALAGLLGISPNNVSISSKEKCSVEIIVDLPQESAEDLIARYRQSAPEVEKRLISFKLRNLNIYDQSARVRKKRTHIGLRREEDIVILELRGNLAVGAGDAGLRAAVNGLLDQGERKILIDLKRIKRMDSSGFGELVGSVADAESMGATTKLLVDRVPRGRLLMTSLVSEFEIFDDEIEAISSYRS